MSQIKKFDFHLVDHSLKNINQIEGAILLPSPIAWQKFTWVRKLFIRQPQEGYFIWVKKSQSQPLSSCLSLETVNSKQNLINLIIVEEKVKVKIFSLCNALREDLEGEHIGFSKVFLKKRAKVEILHQHRWGKKDKVQSQIEFYLSSQAQIRYRYHNFQPAQKLAINNKIFLEKEAKADFFLAAKAKNSEIKINESLFLKDKDASGSLVLRLVGREKSSIKAVSQIKALKAGRGHLDCQGLLVGKKAKIDLIPQLINENDQALITHEASIGRIEKTKLEYLQSRGLTEKKAIDLIVRGFLK